jgi:ribose 5-phosphate isomerase RpiB
MNDNLKFPSGKIYIGADVEGYTIKQNLKSSLTEKGFLIVDLGTFDIENDIVENKILAREVAEKVLENEDSCDVSEPVSMIHGCKSVGLLLVNNGVEALSVVSKMEGIEAVLCSTLEMAKNAKNMKANLLCIGLDSVDSELVEKMIFEYLN